MNKAVNSDVTSALLQKANISDVSRTVADIQNCLDDKISRDDLHRYLDDRVSKQDIQYMLSNKVSIEELQRVLQTKSNVHETNLDISQLNQKLDDMLCDLNKRINNCANQKDFAFLNTVVDKKADIEYLNEMLSQKANK